MSALFSQAALETWRRRPDAPPKLREAKFDDYVQIVSLQSRYRFESKSYDQWLNL
jgi:hypothetical protein